VVDLDSTALTPVPYRIENDGYAGYEWMQGASETDVRIAVTLVALPRKQPAERRQTARPLAPSRSPAPARPPSRPAADDIRMER
jgi:hypothetical protein